MRLSARRHTQTAISTRHAPWARKRVSASRRFAARGAHRRGPQRCATRIGSRPFHSSLRETGGQRRSDRAHCKRQAEQPPCPSRCLRLRGAVPSDSQRKCDLRASRATASL
eukprot:scaffold2790_cov122-Isochrysis_galbana.AAC.3